MVGTRTEVFSRVSIDFLTTGGSRVTWRLRDFFDDPQPYSFQLQVGESGVLTADDWANTGAPVVDTFQAIDATARFGGIAQTTHYRVQLTTPAGVYLSPPVACWGRLHRQDWLIARAIVRRAKLHSTVGAAEYGWLFKRRKRTAVVPDHRVVDPLTGEIIKTVGTAGVGTARTGGYFPPVPFLVDLNPGPRYNKRDDQAGQTDNIACQGRCVGFPLLEHGDVIATATGDARYLVHEIPVEMAIRNVPILVAPKLHKLGPEDPVYDLPIPAPPSLANAGREQW